MARAPSPLRDAPRSIWLWVIAGSLIGGGICALLVGRLGGDRSGVIVILGAMQGLTPGLVYLTSARLRPPTQPYRPATWSSLVVALVILGVALGLAMWIGYRSTSIIVGRWASVALGFSGSSIGSTLPPLIYERRHAHA